MSVTRWISLIVGEAFGGATVYWMRDGDGKVALHACMRVGASNQQMAAAKAESVAGDVVRSMGCKAGRMGSFMRGDCRGEVTAVGVAEVPWSPRVEHELSRMGLAEVR